ncbi:WD40 repeat domain-containing protein [Tessaracoccus sp. OH4464_COT-324]|uniref:WD40 repeat domain-containing protein n=1 Tax=Tessaracoccus sp. OH4464_COT-324 TaxID=2491059 RepID=UPI001319FD72|nr:hypothetical protein [Tessaracoccus sp. OH4464_COT-324]
MSGCELSSSGSGGYGLCGTSDSFDIITDAVYMSGLYVSPDGAWVATGHQGRMYVWNSTTGQVSFDAGYIPFVEFAAWSVDSAEFVVADCKNIRRYDAACGGYFGSYSGHVAKQVSHFMTLVRDGKFTPDGTRLLTLGADNTIRAWSVASGRQIGQAKPDRTGHSFLLAPDGTRATLIHQELDEEGNTRSRYQRSFDPNTLLPTGDWEETTDRWLSRFLGDDKLLWESKEGAFVTNLDGGDEQALLPDDKEWGWFGYSASTDNFLISFRSAGVAIVSLDGRRVIIPNPEDEGKYTISYFFSTGEFSPDGSIVYLVHPITGPAAYDAATGEKRLQFETPASE